MFSSSLPCHPPGTLVLADLALWQAKAEASIELYVEGRGAICPQRPRPCGALSAIQAGPGLGLSLSLSLSLSGPEPADWAQA
jgi:hypothetical protein